jgi:hypothetical protein
MLLLSYGFLLIDSTLFLVLLPSAHRKHLLDVRSIRSITTKVVPKLIYV